MSSGSNKVEEGAASSEVTQLAEAIPASSRLEQLPVELISVVFDHLYPDHQKRQWEPLIKDPMSKSLLPFVRQNLFKKLRFIKLDRFLDFCEMVEGTKYIVDSVQDLAVDSCRRSVELSAESESSVLAFFASAIQIRQLRCTNPTLSHLVLSAAFASNLPSNSMVGELSIRVAASASTLSQELRSIRRWKGLRKLVVAVEGDRVGEESVGGDFASMKHPNVRELTLRVLGDTSRSGRSEEVAEFVKSFPKLKAIELTWRPEEFDGILDALNKDKMKSLKLIGPFGFSTAVDCTDALLRFQNLTSLSFHANILTSNFVNKIGQLTKLQRLALYPDSVPKALDIEKILTTTRPKSLKLLFLAHSTYTDADDDFFIDDDDFFIDDDGPFERDWDEEIPEWSTDFSCADAESLRELAKVEGVKLGPKFHAALEAQSRYDQFIVEREDHGYVECYDEY